LFYATLDEMMWQRPDDDVTAIIARLWESRPIAESTRNAHLTDRALSPLIEPLIPAVLRAVEFWGARAASLTLIHDEQSALTPARVAEMAAIFAEHHPGHRLTAVH